eukprot:6695662-Prymnesium_polylepis.1
MACHARVNLLHRQIYFERLAACNLWAHTYGDRLLVGFAWSAMRWWARAARLTRIKHHDHATRRYCKLGLTLLREAGGLCGRENVKIANRLNQV